MSARVPSHRGRNRESPEGRCWRFVCPGCKVAIAHEREGANGSGSAEGVSDPALQCSRCGRIYVCSSHIWRFLPKPSQVEFQQFLREYRVVRQREGWGRPDAAYYRALPQVAPNDPQSTIWRRRSRSYETLLDKIIDPAAARWRRPLRIVDLGAGNCWLAFRLAELGHDVAAIDLSDDAIDGLGAQAWYQNVSPASGARRTTRAGCSPFTFIQAEFDGLPLDDAVADIAVFNASLHYSTDCSVTLGEALRVLSRDGVLVIMDSPLYRRAESGEEMVRERQREFERDYGFRANRLPAENFLTWTRLDKLAGELGFRWRAYRPGGPSRLRSQLTARWRRLRGRRELAEMPVIAGYRA